MKKRIICTLLMMSMTICVFSCANQKANEGQNASTTNIDTANTINDHVTETAESIQTTLPNSYTDFNVGLIENTDPIGGYTPCEHFFGYHGMWGMLAELCDNIDHDKFHMLSANKNYHKEYEGCQSINLRDYVREFDISRDVFEESYYNYGYYCDLDLDFFWNATDEEMDAWGKLPYEEACPNSGVRYNEVFFKAALIDLIISSKNKDIEGYVFKFKEFSNERYAENYEKYVFDDYDYQVKDPSPTDPEFHPVHRLCAFQFTYAEFVKDTGIEKEEFQNLWDYYIKNPVGDSKQMYRLDLDKLYDNIDYYISLVGTEGYEYPVLVDELIKCGTVDVPVK